MNERFELGPPIEPRTFDRLVDGELAAEEERALLRSLDARPDGWRRCALAFLEARVWKDSLTGLAGGQHTRVNGTPVMCEVVESSLTNTVARSSDRRWTRVLTIAASLGLAFFFGIAVRGYWGDGPPPREGVNMISEGAGGSEHGWAASDGEQLASHAHVVAKPTLTMSLVGNQGDVEREIEIPVIETDRLDLNWLASQPQAVPDETIAALRRSGFRVEEQRWFVPVLLDDGRPAIVPLDRLQVKYAGVQF